MWNKKEVLKLATEGQTIEKPSDIIKNRNYWKYLKSKLKKEGNELVSATNQLKLVAADGKKYNTDVLDFDGIVALAKVFSSPTSTTQSSHTGSAAHFLGDTLIATGFSRARSRICAAFHPTQF